MRFALAVDVREEEKLLISLDHETGEVHRTELVLHLGEIGHQRGKLFGERLCVGGMLDREVKNEMTLAHSVRLSHAHFWNRVCVRACSHLRAGAPADASSGWDEPSGPRRAMSAVRRREGAVDHRTLRTVGTRGDPVRDQSQTPSHAAAEVVEMDSEVGGERHPARELHRPDRADRPAAPHDGQRALVEVAERRDRPRSAGADRLCDMVRLLDRNRRQTGQGTVVGAARLELSPITEISG